MSAVNSLALGALVVATGGVASAAGVCDDMDQAMQIAQSGAPASTATFTLPGDPDAHATCRVSTDLSGANSVNCHWPFAYRAETATAAFADLNAALGACTNAGDAPAQDQPVNHPDSYELRIFQTITGEVGLSLKDKAALQQGYVFLRATPRR